MSQRCLLKGLALTITAPLFLTAAMLKNPVSAQCPSQSTEITCEPTRTEYEECKPPNEQEQKLERFVLEQVRTGRAIKLSDSKVKTLRGCFIRNLLTAKSRAPQIGIVIDGAIIEGPIDIRNENIVSQVELTHCTFLDDVNLKRSHFSKGLSFAHSQFGSDFSGPGRLDMESATIDFDLVLEDCIFRNCFTLFKSIKVGIDMSLRRAKLAGKVDFTGINVGGSFFADKEKPNDPQTEFHGKVDFEAAKVGLDAGLSNVVFDDTVDFGNAEFNNFSVIGSTFNGDVSFKGTKMGDFYFCDAQDAHPENHFKKCLTIEDMSFQYMSPEDWNELEGFALKTNDQPKQKSYSAQFYANLEAQFRRHGLPDQADEIYIASMEEERKSLGLWRQLISYILDKSIGYGRHLEKLLYLWSPLFLLTGCAVFWSETNMETKKPEEAEHYKGRYRAGWYVIDLFVPIINLGEADVWTPKQRWRIWWKHFHRIIGNLFVPIGLAALTGIIK